MSNKSDICKNTGLVIHCTCCSVCSKLFDVITITKYTLQPRFSNNFAVADLETLQCPTCERNRQDSLGNENFIISIGSSRHFEEDGQNNTTENSMDNKETMFKQNDNKDKDEPVVNEFNALTEVQRIERDFEVIKRENADLKQKCETVVNDLTIKCKQIKL